LNFLGVIPARFSSSRFPGKPLALINGISMINRVYEQAKKSTLVSKVVVATDDARIKLHVESFGGEVLLTSSEHKSGTDRCYEALTILHKIEKHKRFDAVINIQGDEPFINPEEIDTVCNCFKEKDIQIATLIKKISTNEELINSNVVKVIVDKNKKALYFSRAVIPFVRGIEQGEWLKNYAYYKHIGIYAYTVKTLEEITKLSMSELEKTESLEQLRWLENGYSIKTEITEYESHAVDTPEDLLKIEQIYSKI
jgi:3-deoxy-manno-octulosonate cytidylyltransferase (CMP-KDO synthetase)